MRSIRLALRNLLVVITVVVLLTQACWAVCSFPDYTLPKFSATAPDKHNEELVEACIEQSSSLNKNREESDVASAICARSVAPSIPSTAGASEVAGTASANAKVAGVSNFEMAVHTRKLASYCHKACAVSVGMLKPDDDSVKQTKSKADATKEMKKIDKKVCGVLDYYAVEYDRGLVGWQIADNSAKKAKGSLLTKLAIGAAAVGGGVLLLDHINDKKKEKREAKAAEEKDRADKGIIKDADGKDLVCFSEQNYLRVECSETMLGLCQAGKSTTAGCKAFNSNYCASSGSGTNYCLYADSRTYCSQSGSLIASSPACTWSASRSDECKKNPEQVSCLYSGSADSLTLACANYPSDPICAAHGAGRIVVQGGAAATSTTETASAGTTESGATNTEDYGDGASVTMSSVIASGSSSTTTPSSTDASSTTLASTDSMFTSSSSVASKACADGLLQNCGN